MLEPRWTTTPARPVAAVLLLAVVVATAVISRPADVLGQSGPASVTTEKSQYQIGGSIRICYRVPGPGLVTITDTQGGTSNVILSGNDDGRGDCISGRVEPPPGQECFRLDYAGSRGSATAQTCITVIGQPSSNPGAGNSGSGDNAAGSGGTASISTEKATYQVNDPIRICFTVPGPGPITITDTQGGSSNTLASWNDDGRGGCVNGMVTPPIGQECFRLDYQGTRGSGTAQTCIEVSEPSGGNRSAGAGSGPVAGGTPPPSPGPASGGAPQAGPGPATGVPSSGAAGFPPSSGGGTPTPGWPTPFTY